MNNSGEVCWQYIYNGNDLSCKDVYIYISASLVDECYIYNDW